MRTTKLGKHEVVIYDAIEELPIKRFHAFNKMMLVDSGIGSDLSDFDVHLQKAIMYIGSNPDLAKAELMNMRQNVYMIQSEISPKHLAFASLVKSIDGKEYDDLTDEGLQRVVDIFSDVPVQEVTAQIEAVKKKINEELQLYFPKIFDDAEIKEYFDELKRRTMCVLNNIIEGESEERNAEIERITTDLLTYSKPMIFSGSNNQEIIYDKNFERMCATLSQYLHIDPKKYTVMEFYNAFEYVKDMLKAKEKAYKGGYTPK